MKVSPKEPFQLIYSLFAHEYLGYLIESFVIQLDSNNRLTFKHQNISHHNAAEFAEGLEEDDYKIIELMDSIQQDAVVKKFQGKKVLKPADFFSKVYDKEKGDKELQKLISDYVDGKKSQIFPLLTGKKVFVMGNDGEPAWQEVETPTEPGSVLFHFYKNEDSTHYLPTIKHGGQKIEFQYNNSQVVCNEPAWLLVEERKLIHFQQAIDGKKLKPFLNKKFINIPKKVEETYYNNFVTQIVANFKVHAKGFDIVEEKGQAKTSLSFNELAEAGQADLFSEGKNLSDTDNIGKIVFQLNFHYGNYKFSSSTNKAASVKIEKDGDNYTFYKVIRDLEYEKSVISILNEKGLIIKNGRAAVPKPEAFTWINQNKEVLKEVGIEVTQSASTSKKYFIGKSSINIEVKESNDWFDIHAKVKFGDYEIPFIQLRKYIVAERREFKLPNGEIAVIPEEWLIKYKELFSFSDEEGGQITLQKHHVALVQELDSKKGATVTIDSKLEKLRDFEDIEDFPMPKDFEGELRPYQKAGYNWLQFLHSFKFGGCLADDMGLGKTVQTLSFLQYQKEQGVQNASLLIMPTSLVYNWQKEAEKFVPNLRVLDYTGTNRKKDITHFQHYDIVITSYGTARIDVDLLKEYYFNYVILDESQTIKNPSSNIFSAVTSLKSAYKLILTGTPVENTTLDLWSQMTFINKGLLGSQKFFKDNFLVPIEKKQDQNKTEKLHAIIKPFVLRRQKSQVLTELPDKIEQVLYTEMTDDQSKEYEEIKSYYRNKILDEIDSDGLGKSKMTLLQGLTKLRQIANHPKLADQDYKGESGKYTDVLFQLENAKQEGHKILIFSQFVKHLAIFKDYLEKEKIEYAYLDGATKDRQGQVEFFQNNENVQVFLISLKAGGLGLNLTKADYVFILDPWWNPAIEAQAVDRAHRMGQENVVHTYKFITKDTVEEKILKLQESKKKLASSLISTEDSFVKSLTQEDIQQILA